MTIRGFHPSRLRWLSGLALALLLTSSCAGGEGASGRDRFLSLGTGGTGGVYYVIGGALASRLSLKDGGRQYTAEVTGGSVENVNRVREGQIDLAFALSNTAYDAYHGSDDYPRPVTGLRVLAPLYPNVTHVLVRGKSSIRSLADLRGTRVSVGAAGSGTEQHSRHLLGVAGLTYDDIQARYLSFNESAAALADGAIDAAIISVGYPASAVLEATTTGGARLIGISDDEMARLRADHPYYARGTIRQGLYRGVTDEIPTVSTMNWIVAMDSLGEDVIGVLLDVLQDDLEALARAHEMGGQIDLNDLTHSPIPVHRAVHAWWHERFGTELQAPSDAP